MTETGYEKGTGTDFWNIAKVIVGLLILAVIFAGIVSVVISFADSANIAVEDKTIDTSGDGDGLEAGTGTNVSEEIETFEDMIKDADYLVVCESNLKTKSIKSFEDLEFRYSNPPKEDGVWFTKKPIRGTGDRYCYGNVIIYTLVERRNFEKFFLKTDDIMLSNLRIVDSGHGRYDLLVDVSTSPIPAMHGGVSLMSGYDSIEPVTTAKESVLLAKNRELKNLEVLEIFIEYTVVIL